MDYIQVDAEYFTTVGALVLPEAVVTMLPRYMKTIQVFHKIIQGLCYK